jgi:hypothetical protein
MEGRGGGGTFEFFFFQARCWLHVHDLFVLIGLKYTAGICSVAERGVTFRYFGNFSTGMVPDKRFLINEKHKRIFSL